MVQISSDMQFSLWNFRFQKAVTYDHSAFDAGAKTYNSNDLPGFRGEYSFDSQASFWDGDTGAANSARMFSYLGDAFAVNSDDHPASGTVTGLIAASGTESAYIIGMSVAAADILAAYETGATVEDDLALLRAMLSGDDTAQLSAYADRLYMHQGDDTVFAGAGDDVISGMQGRDLIQGDAGHDLLMGGYGYDRLVGGLGNDSLYGDEGNDVLSGMQNRDFLFGGTGDDRLSGGFGQDRLNGGAGADTLQGGIGADRLDGGLDDSRDVFVFASVDDSAEDGPRDTILNFVSGIDKIDLSDIDVNAEVEGDQDFTFGDTTPGNHAVWLESTTGGVIVKADVTGDGLADLSIRVANVTGLVATDFLL